MSAQAAERGAKQIRSSSTAARSESVVRGLLRVSPVRERTWPFLLDAAVFGAVIAAVYAIGAVGHYWLGAVTPAAEISRSPTALPLYAFYSLVRMTTAYLLSLVFAVAYGYIACYNKRLQGIMLAALDILQSIPVLSFLPGVMLAMVSLFPTRQLESNWAPLF